MPKFYDPALLEETFHKALKGEIQCSPNAANLPVGVVQLSGFKFHYVVTVEPNEFLPEPEQMMHLHMWDHLKGSLAKPLLTELEALISEMLARLIGAGVVTVGGKVKGSSGMTEYPADDWIVSTSIQVKVQK